MDKLLDIILCGTTTIFELIAILIVAILIQAIVYKLTGISLFNKFTKIVFRADRYVATKFN